MALLASNTPIKWICIYEKKKTKFTNHNFSKWTCNAKAGQGGGGLGGKAPTIVMIVVKSDQSEGVTWTYSRPITALRNDHVNY